MAVAKLVDSERFQTDHVVTVVAGHAVHDTYTAFLPPLLPAFIANLSLNKTEAGGLAVFVELPSLLQPIIGHLDDRLNLRLLVILAPAVSAAVMSMLGLAPGYGFIAVLLALAGLSSAGLHAVAPVLVGHLSGRNLGRGMGFWMVGGELGRTVGPLVIVTAVHYLGFNGLPWLMLGGILVSMMLYLRLRDVPARPANARPAPPWRPALASMRPILVPLAGILAMRTLLFTAFNTYLPILLTEQGADLWLAGASLTILEATGSIGALFGGALSDRLGRRTVLVTAQVASAILTAVFLAAGGWLQFPVLLLLGFPLFSITPVIMAIVQENAGDSRALANGIYMALSFGIRAACLLILGILGDRFGLYWTFVASAVVMLFGLPFTFLFPRERRQPALATLEG